MKLIQKDLKKQNSATETSYFLQTKKSTFLTATAFKWEVQMLTYADWIVTRQQYYIIPFQTPVLLQGIQYVCGVVFT